MESFLLLGLHTWPVRTLTWGNRSLEAHVLRCRGQQTLRGVRVPVFVNQARWLHWHHRQRLHGHKHGGGGHLSHMHSGARGPACGATLPIAPAMTPGCMASPSCGCMQAGVEWSRRSIKSIVLPCREALGVPAVLLCKHAPWAVAGLCSLLEAHSQWHPVGCAAHLATMWGDAESVP